MKQINYEQLIKIYNTLLMVSTRGEDTIIMSQCLNALREFLTQSQQEIIADSENIIE